MRSRHKEWSNGRHGTQKTATIVWFQGSDDNDIRLNLTDVDMSINIFPKDKQAADDIWTLFRSTAPERSIRQPFVANFLILIKDKINHKTRRKYDD